MKERASAPSVMTWGVLVRIDSDWIRLRYSERIRRALMQTPELIVKQYYQISRASISAGLRR
jgi:hypothetical protein